MTDIQIVKSHLPDDIWDLAMEYTIPSEFIQDVPELIEMVLRSRSIDTKEEKQNRFNLLPLMNDVQVEKLRAILIKEKVKLKEIEDRYEKKKLEIKKKYLTKWQEMWYVKKVSDIRDKEDAEQQKDEQEADSLLDMI